MSRPQALVRLRAVDTLRGAAMLWMTAFHCCFDLQYFGLLHTNFYDNPLWTLQRKAIVSLFLFCAGVGQAIAVHQGQPWQRFWSRWRHIAGAALLVSLASYLMFPDSYIYFGILHGMALMLVLTRAVALQLRRHVLLLWPLGTLALCLPLLAGPLHAVWSGADLLDSRAWNWLGIISRKPVTEDYAPLFPWLGVMLWGVAGGHWWLDRNAARATMCHASASSAPARALSFLGRHSLPYYLLHQPLMIGGLALLTALLH